ncbi:hypothetical protein KIN20_026461 [Parelaphostrongylus tenuis]|uniref:Uncharacterized protein n=1 Tax=Parelaphostrongylus tenuis TaxID=148309 RepID=A0AAD5WD30_PARTN|nr:hypothetical protein KIN20_026461 [Parelaphostrongylus tenuis]
MIVEGLYKRIKTRRSEKTTVTFSHNYSHYYGHGLISTEEKGKTLMVEEGCVYPTKPGKKSADLPMKLFNRNSCYSEET